MSRRAILIPCLLAATLACGVVRPAFGEELRLRTDKYLLKIDGRTGDHLTLTDRVAKKPLVISGGIGWTLSGLKGVLLDSSKVKSGPARAAGTGLAWTWEDAAARVAVALDLTDRDGLGLRIAVTNRRVEPVTEITFPAGIAINQRHFEELIVSDHIGIALSMARWFERGGTLGDGIPYPPAHADLLVARGTGGRPSVSVGCPHTEPFLTPSQIGYGKTGEHTGSFWHRFLVWIPKDRTWTSPTIYVASTPDVFAAFDQYRRQLGLDRAATLREKLGDRFDRASRAVVLKYECAWHEGKAIRGFADLVKDLPAPLIFQPVEYWPSKFDDHYPDYFPINSKLGTDEDFRKMIADAHARGHLVMPFFSPGHWSLDSPSTKKAGEKVAAVGFDRKPYIYDGRPNYGVNYYVTAWNPIVVDKAQENLRQMNTFGCDAAFADIVGNNKKDWDFNSRTPNPRAFFAGMVRLGEAMAKVLPVTTEGGNDLHSANFWGMFQFFLKVKYKFTGHLPWKASDGYDPKWAGFVKEKQARLYPMGPALVSGLTMLYPHNLGPPILEPEMLADSLAMGMGLYMRYQEVTEGREDWLKYLHYVQQEVVRHYFGRRMTGFEYVQGYDAVSVTRWGDLALYVNHTAKPATVSVGGQAYSLAPFGMLRVLGNQAAVIPVFEVWKHRR